MDRLAFIILRGHVAPVEFWISVQHIFFASWILATGGGESYQATIFHARRFLPISTGRLVLMMLILLATARIYATLTENLFLRRWLARGLAFHWLAVLLAFILARTPATELPVYATNCLINLWLQFRLDERFYRNRNAGRAAAA